MTIKPCALAFGGRNFIGGLYSAPFDTYIMCSIPSLDRAYTRLGAPRPNSSPGGLTGLGRGAALETDDVTSANVTAPLPGSPTAPFAGPLRPKPPPGPGAPANSGIAVTVGRATLAVIPPGQVSDPT